MALCEVDQKGGDQALKNNGLAKNQDCHWLDQQDINTCMNNYEATKQSNKWLRQNGIAPETMNELEVQLLQAQKIAYNLLKDCGKLLGPNEATTLNNFLQASRNSTQRKKLTVNACYKVMNIGAAVNRKLFKSHRQLNQGK
jgi:hypothetical protein